MTVVEYEREFLILSKYTCELVSTDVEMCTGFE